MEKKKRYGRTDLVLDGEIDEVGVHNNPVRRPERHVVAEEQRRGDLRPASTKQSKVHTKNGIL
jgi:hypothetical protein